MTIAIICAVYTAIVVMLLRFIRLLHDCDGEIRKMEEREQFERAHRFTENPKAVA